jgi:hypothetical protein
VSRKPCCPDQQAGDGRSGGDEDIRTAGSPPAYQDVPEFTKFVESDSARLIEAVKKIGKVE